MLWMPPATLLLVLLLTFSLFFPPTYPLRQLDGLVVTWKRNGRQLSSGHRLIIPAAASSDTGLYVCEASLGNSTAKPVEARAQLTVIGKKKTKTKTNTQCIMRFSVIIMGSQGLSVLIPQLKPLILALTSLFCPRQCCILFIPPFIPTFALKAWPGTPQADSFN